MIILVLFSMVSIILTETLTQKLQSAASAGSSSSNLKSENLKETPNLKNAENLRSERSANLKSFDKLKGGYGYGYGRHGYGYN